MCTESFRRLIPPTSVRQVLALGFGLVQKLICSNHANSCQEIQLTKLCSSSDMPIHQTSYYCIQQMYSMYRNCIKPLGMAPKIVHMMKKNRLSSYTNPAVLFQVSTKNRHCKNYTHPKSQSSGKIFIHLDSDVIFFCYIKDAQINQECYSAHDKTKMTVLLPTTETTNLIMRTTLSVFQKQSKTRPNPLVFSSPLLIKPQVSCLPLISSLVIVSLALPVIVLPRAVSFSESFELPNSGLNFSYFRTF